MLPPPSYLNTTHTGTPVAPPPPPPPGLMGPGSREEMLEGRIVALTKENERLRHEAHRFAPHPSHSRTSSSNGITIQREGHGTPNLVPRLSEDDMQSLNTSQTETIEQRYAQLLSEYRRVCQLNEQLQGRPGGGGNTWLSTPRGGGGPSVPQTGDFGPNATAYWNQAAATFPGLNGSINTQNAQPPFTPTLGDRGSPTFNGSQVANKEASPAPQSPKVLPQPSPTTRGPSKLSAPPSSQSKKNISKKQQESQVEAMSKEAYITYLERNLQLKEDQLSRFEGQGPTMVDSTVQATVWTSTARTQTTDIETKQESPVGTCESDGVKGCILDARCLLLESGFTTLRPLTLQLHVDSSVAPSTTAEPSSPQPRYTHRPYGLTKKRSSGQLSEDSNDHELMPAPVSSLRWADEPCDLELQPPLSPDRRPSVANASTSSWRGDSLTSAPLSRGSGLLRGRGSRGSGASTL